MARNDDTSGQPRTRSRSPRIHRRSDSILWSALSADSAITTLQSQLEPSVFDSGDHPLHKHALGIQHAARTLLSLREQEAARRHHFFEASAGPMHFEQYMSHMGRALALATDVLNANVDFMGHTSYHVDGARVALRRMRSDGLHAEQRADQCYSTLLTFVQDIGLAILAEDSQPLVDNSGSMEAPGAEQAAAPAAAHVVEEALPVLVPEDAERDQTGPSATQVPAPADALEADAALPVLLPEAEDHALGVN